MATDPEFPIELRAKPGTKLVGLAIAVFLFGYGGFLVESQSMGSVPAPLVGHIPATTFGYIAAVLGIGLAIATVQALVSDRPKLVLDADGLAFAPNFGAERRVAWSEIADLAVYSGRYGSGVEISMRASKRMKIPALQNSAEDMLDLMLRGLEGASQAGVRSGGESRCRSNSNPSAGSSRG